MQKKKVQWAVVVIVLLVVLMLVGVGALLVRKPATLETGSSAVPASSEAEEEEPDSAPESQAASESTASSEKPKPQPASAAASQEVLPDEEENGASIPESESVSSEAVPDSTAASHEAASSAAHSTASSHAAASAQAGSSSAGSAASDSIASLESFGDPRIDEYVSEIRSLQKRSQRELYQIMSDAYDEYMQYPVEKRSLSLKVSIVLGKTAELTSMQNQCDKEFKTITRELRTYLRENGYDQSIADEAEKEYQEKKDAMTKELTSLTYSQVTGSGDGSHWLIEHYDEMMGE